MAKRFAWKARLVTVPMSTKTNYRGGSSISLLLEDAWVGEPDPRSPPPNNNNNNKRRKKRSASRGLA